MFEYNGIEYSTQQLQDAALGRNIPFDQYLEAMKEKGLVEKQIGSTVDPTMGQDDMGSQLDDGSSESQDDNVNWFDQTWFGRGVAAASTTGEATDLMAQDFSNIDMKSIQEFMKAKEGEAKAHVPSERMTKFQKKYKEEGSTWSAFFRGVKDQPGLLPELFVQSLGTQVGTLIDSPTASLAAAGTGAAGGAAIGAAPGAVAGFMGGLATSMEAALTFGELIETELKEEGKEFTDENIKALLEGPKGNSIRNRAIGRGLTIGAVEGFTGGIAGKAAVATRGAVAAVRGAKTAAVAAGVAGVAVEGVGGGVGEVLGRVAADQEMDAAEIGFEAITGTTTAPINILTALKSAKQPTYNLNGVDVTYKEMKDFVETADDIDVAKAKIKIEDDFTGVGTLATKKQNKAIVDSQIDEKITDKKDRNKLIELNDNRIEAEANVKKKGIDKVPNAPEELATIQAEIDAIIGKYEGAIGIGETQKAQDVAKVVRENRISETIAFAETQGKKIGKETVVVDNNEQAQAAHDKIAKEMGLKAQDVTDADGFIIGDSIVINKDIAGRTGAINVGAHEVLHGVLAKHMQGLDIAGKKKLISSFKNVLSKKQLAAVTTRLQDNYKDQIAADPDFMDTTDEWFTAFSDAIEQNEIAFDEGVFSKLKNTIQEILRRFGIKKDFADGRQAYNFLKDYSRSIENNKLSSRAMALAGEGATVTEGKFSMSKDQTDSVNELAGMGWTNETWKEQGADFAIKEMKGNKMLDGLIRSKYKADVVPSNFVDLVYSELVSHVKNFKPEQNDNLFGWVNSQIANKAGNVYNREFKVAEEMKGAKDIGKTTKEGEVKVQVAAETDTAMEALETEDLSPAARAKKKADKAKGKEKVESKFRKQLGIETGGKLYNKVLDSAKKALLRAYEAGTSVRNIQRKLRDEANVYLFKEIKNLLGTKKYISNLKEFRIPIIEAIFTADLIQIERNVPENKRVFTKFVKKLTSKAEVQAAVDQNLLPASALNIIDKGTAVSLYEKAMPTEKQFVSFFDQPLKIPALDKRGNQMMKDGFSLMIRSGLKGTRKDALTKAMAGALSYDATMQVAQEQDVIEKREQLAALKGETLAEDNLETLAAAIGRDTNVKFSKSILTEKQTKNISLYLQNEINKLEGLPQNFVSTIKELIDDGVGIIEAYETARAETGIDSAALDLIFKNGKFNNSHIDNIIYGIKKFGVAKVRKLGYDASVNYLKNNIKGKSLKAKIELTNNFLINVGRSARSTKVYGITTNESLLANLIDQLGDQDIIENYRLVDAKIKGKKLQYKDNETNSFKDVPLYENIENIKDNAYKSQSLRKKINEQAVKAKEFISKIVFDKVLTKEEKNAIITLASFDQRGALRKSFDLGMYVNRNVLDLDSTKTILEHELTIKDTLNLIKDVINKNKSQEVLRNILNKSKVHVLPKSLDNILNSENLKSKGSFERYNNKKFRKALQKLINNGSVVNSNISFSKSQDAQTLGKAVKFSRSANKPTKGITVLDFDDTLATTKSLVKFTRPDGTTGTLNAEQYASTYENLLDQGYTFDFSEFNKVVKGKLAPLFQKALKLQGKFGPENMFVLTARPPQAAKAIFDFLKANGLNIPIKNITGLGNSTAEAKALWIADKVGDGFNDFYFADDALQNVQAVKNMLDQFDVKSKVQQAKVKFSKNMNNDFNKILEEVTGIEAKKRFSIIKGRKRGESKGKFRYFVPPSHEDFVGLLYNFMGKGKEGNKHRDFLEQALVRPLNRANRELDTARQSVANDYKALNKQFEDVKSKLTKKTPDGDFVFQDAIRVYLWDKHGHKIPGLSETDQRKLSELVMSDPQLQAYAETLNIISKQETYVNPTDGWNSGDIRMDLDDATGRIGREQYFSEFIENAEIIFSEENLNKIEAGYGESVRESLEDMLYRIKTGRNRPSGSNKQVNKLMNFLNGSVGTVMFFNMRSALLQQMSIVNYINFADNNIFAAAKAFANQKQYWADWSFIFNSDMLKQRRGGIQTDVNGAELAASLRSSKNPTRKLISKLLELGFLPTQIGDNIAIATGGASYYRNRINTYLKQGLSQKEAEAKAFTDFQDITQSTQQSARPDMVSKQQASVIGKVILNFQNVTSQFNRLGKKAFQDIYNRRITKPNTTQMQSDISNASRITYYFAVQNLIFYTLQTAMFAMMFDDDEEDVNNLFLKKRERLINGSIDSVLRGTGLIGGVVATLKNVAIAFARQRDVNYNPDESAVIVEALNLSPVIGIKARQIVNAEKTLNYNKKVIKEMETFDIDNPQWSAATNYVQTFTNIPLNRLYNKTQNVRQALNNDHAAWERSLMFLGWSQYNLDLENKKMEGIKESVKGKKKSLGGFKAKTFKKKTF